MLPVKNEIRQNQAGSVDTVMDFSTLDLLMFLLVIVATAPWNGWNDRDDG